MNSSESYLYTMADVHSKKQRSYNMSQIYEEKGLSQKALTHYKKFIAARDSLVNEENTKKTVQLEMNYEFDKKEAATKLEQEKKDAVAAAETRKQRIILLAISGFGLLVLGFAIFAYRSFLQKKKANEEISKQKELIEEKQKEILDSIHYAKRIQTALIPSERYIERCFKKLGRQTRCCLRKDCGGGFGEARLKGEIFLPLRHE